MKGSRDVRAGRSDVYAAERKWRFSCRFAHAWSEVFDLPVGHGWEARENFSQVGEWINAESSPALDHGVDDGAALPLTGVAD